MGRVGLEDKKKWSFGSRKRLRIYYHTTQEKTTLISTEELLPRDSQMTTFLRRLLQDKDLYIFTTKGCIYLYLTTTFLGKTSKTGPSLISLEKMKIVFRMKVGLQEGNLAEEIIKFRPQI